MVTEILLKKIYVLRMLPINVGAYRIRPPHGRWCTSGEENDFHIHFFYSTTGFSGVCSPMWRAYAIRPYGFPAENGFVRVLGLFQWTYFSVSPHDPFSKLEWGMYRTEHVLFATSVRMPLRLLWFGGCAPCLVKVYTFNVPKKIGEACCCVLLLLMTV